MTDTLCEIGRIKQVQVQRSPLKTGEQPNRVYSPAPLLVVESLLLTPDGIIGLTADGGRIMDVHHVAHPQSRNNKGQNGISIGFTVYYETMRARFGPHMADGCAGENILIETDADRLSADDLGTRLAIQNAITGEIVILTDLLVAAPCVAFSHFADRRAAPLAAEQLRETLDFLSAGRRGFYATLPPDQPQATVRAGDRAFVFDNADAGG